MFGASLESEQSRGYVPGHVLANRYELVRLLGEGGTGVVWVANDRVLNLEVAVKLVQTCGATHDDFARRARLEACSAARIAHPAVCRAMDFGLSAYGEPFIVSELLAGESLDEAISREGRLEPTHAVRLLLPILDALRAAHESGIVHRDVKPANIFLAGDGLHRLQPKLLDFGIASWLGDADANDAGICGTPDYMSPEQVRGSDEIDARSDLWNFCATLYEALTGVVPFRAATQAAVLCAVQSTDPDPITTFCAGDDELSAIVLRGLVRERDARFQSAGELAVELCQWLLAKGVETDICDHSLRARLLDHAGPDSGHDATSAHVVPRSEATPRVRRLWIAAAAGVALVALASSLQALHADEVPLGRPRAHATVALPPSVPLEPPRPAVVPQVLLPASAAAESELGSASAEASLAAVAPARSPARRPLPPQMPGAPASSALADTANGAVTTGVKVAQQPPSARRRATNALNYDFGL